MGRLTHPVMKRTDHVFPIAAAKTVRKDAAVKSML